MSVRAASLFGIVFSCLIFPTASLAQIAPANTTYTVHGVVVNSVTGEPVPRALVQISGERQHSVLTGADGKFEFADVPFGTVNVTYQKPGFFTAQAIRSPRAQAAWITVGPKQLPTVLKLIPEAVISGHVLGDGGEPAEQLPVQIFGSRVENGKRVWNPLKTMRADDLGEFRFADLAPGRYYVFVGPSTWPASFVPARQPRISGRARPAAAGRVPQAARGYPGMFYPAAADMASAAPIEVRAGQRVEINMNVASQLFHYMSGTVSGYPADGQGMNLVAMNAAGQPMNAGFRFDSATGTFRTLWLPPGSYRLRAEMQDPNGVQKYFANQEVNLAGDISGARLNLVPGTTIPVRFQVEKTRNDTGEYANRSETRMGRHGMVQLSGYMPAQVTFVPEDQTAWHPQIGSQLSETDSSAELANVAPGVYSVEIHPSLATLYVQSARCGSLDLLEQKLTVAPGASIPPIEITLRDDYATLAGKIRMTEESEMASVIAILNGRVQQVQNYAFSRAALPPGADSSLDFQLFLAPGVYKVLAVDRIDDLEYSNPEVLEEYADAMREVSIGANDRTKIELRVAHVGE